MAVGGMTGYNGVLRTLHVLGNDFKTEDDIHAMRGEVRISVFSDSSKFAQDINS